jgi:hypothetical protein
LGIALPFAAAQPIGDIDFISQLHLVDFVAAVLNELNGNVIDEAPVVLLQDHQSFAKAFRAERFGFFDQMHYATDDGITHEDLSGLGIGRDDEGASAGWC